MSKRYIERQTKRARRKMSAKEACREGMERVGGKLGTLVAGKEHW